MQISPHELLERAREGDDQAIQALIARYRPAVMAVCHNQLRDHPDAAEDVCQETFVRLIQNLERLQDPTTIPGWLSTVAVNECRDHRARAGRTLEGSPEPEAGYESSTNVLDRLAVRSILAGIGRGHAALLTAYYLEDRPVREIEVERGLSLGSGKVLLHRARSAARAFAESNGLRSLVPVSMWRWIRQGQQRLTQAEPLLAAAGVAGQVVVAAAITIYGLTGPAAMGEERRLVPASSVPSPHPVQGVGSALAAPADRPASVSSRPRSNDGLPAMPGHRREAWVPIGTVPVGSTGHSVGTEAPGTRPRYVIGARQELGDGTGEADVRVVNYNDPEEMDPAYEAACSAAEVSPEATYCER